MYILYIINSDKYTYYPENTILKFISENCILYCLEDIHLNPYLMYT